MRTGRPPKPEGQKVNRAPSIKPHVVLPRKGRTGKVPTPICELGIAGLVLWNAMWRLPEATRWTTADVPALSRLVSLQSDSEKWGDNRLLSEMRQMEDRFGMNAQARQAMGWHIEGDDEATAPATPPPTQVRKDEALRLLRGEAG